MIDLRPVQDKDCERLFHWRREPEVDRWMSDLPVQSEAEHRNWFDDMRRDPDQRALVERYLLDPGRDTLELATFAGLYPNANFMVSNNLLTTVATPTGGQLAAHDAEIAAILTRRLESLGLTVALRFDRL